MPRQARQQSARYYHVMMRGINRQNLFEDDDDRLRFLNTLFRFRDECAGVQIAAWCLMDNHVHLLIGADTPPQELIKKTGCSYVPYFNQKYGRIGHLFQDRYRSEAINDDQYLLAVARYIHMNPEKAGLCQMEDYCWSSYRDYLEGRGKTNTALILEILSGKEGFVQFMREADDRVFLEDNYGLTEHEAIAIAKEILPEGLFSIQSFEKQKRHAAVQALYGKGLTASQIARITGLSKSTVYNIVK